MKLGRAGNKKGKKEKARDERKSSNHNATYLLEEERNCTRGREKSKKEQIASRGYKPVEVISRVS